MLDTLLLTLLPTLVPATIDVPLPAALADHDVTVVMQAGQSTFVLENRSESPQALFVGTRETGLVAPVTIVPGEQVAYSFPPDAAADLFVEVLALDADAWRNTGAFSVAMLQGAADGTVWVTREENVLVTWKRVGTDGAEVMAPAGEILPDAVIAAGSLTVVDYDDESELLSPEPTHVPVIIPDGSVPPPGPPKIEEKPLPAV